MHEPRLKWALGLGYALSPTGADHCHNLHDTAFTKRTGVLEPLGVLDPLPADDLSAGKVNMLYNFLNWRHFMNSSVICQFVPWNMPKVRQLLEGMTGWNTSVHEILKIGERAHNLTRMFNLREGFTKEDDVLPERFHQPFEDGPIAGIAPTGEEFLRARADYYEMAGWDEDGRPTPLKLAELGIEWAQEEM